MRRLGAHGLEYFNVRVEKTRSGPHNERRCMARKDGMI